MKISMIACVTQDMVIGVNDGLLITPFKPDMAHFKEITTNHVIVMGKNTYFTLPKHKPLEGRTNIIISKSLADNPPEGFIVYKSLEDFSESYKDFNDEIFIIGVSKAYDTFMPLTNKLYVTVVKRESTDLLHNIEGFNKKVTRFPSSVFDYKWSCNIIKEDYYLNKKFGIIPYSFLLLTK